VHDGTYIGSDINDAAAMLAQCVEQKGLAAICWPNSTDLDFTSAQLVVAGPNFFKALQADIWRDSQRVPHYGDWKEISAGDLNSNMQRFLDSTNATLLSRWETARPRGIQNVDHKSVPTPSSQVLT
jgi:hypothetical protein